MRMEGRGSFLRLQLQSGRGGLLDLPGELQFRQPLVRLRYSAGRVSFELPGKEQALCFRAELRDGGLSGVVEGPGGVGSFELTRVIDLGEEPYDRCRGLYGSSPEQLIFLGQRKIAGSPAYFYFDGERLVRIYPLSPERFLSERGEGLSFVGGAEGAASVRWSPPTGEAVLIPRRTLYEERQVQFRNGDLTLSGELFLPLQARPLPAVILQHGGNTPERHFCQIYASFFARHGMAALTFDRRGYKSLVADLPALASDVGAAFRFLQGYPGIDPERIGLWGLSCGGWVVPRAAAELPDLAFMVVISGIVHTPAEQETFRRKNELRELGIPEDLVESVGRTWEILYEYGVTRRWDEGWEPELRTLMSRIRREPKLRRLDLPTGRSRWQQPVPPVLSIRTIRQQVGGTLPEMGYDSVAPYRKVTCPVLYMLGEKDSYLPVEESFQRVAQALREAGASEPTFQRVPEAGHCMNIVRPTLGGPQNNLIGLHLHAYEFPPGYLASMVQWMLDRTRNGRSLYANLSGSS